MRSIRLYIAGPGQNLLILRGIDEEEVNTLSHSDFIEGVKVASNNVSGQECAENDGTGSFRERGQVLDGFVRDGTYRTI
jgi:hypothetical protein